ncbi:hypothetical protein G8J22_02702 [Lentilactobacillus hilgardii]|uniref:helix-turn-helix transcriptional regulator n=1 Tax=Lentilactobacillus hilgardii TaxID=1588 RepID=UPI00031EC8C7|nr:helix-turn-helix transcriptional regulator [Lentilactobacillus hilgardii]MCT3396203.1 XRE family transcriptional regulator [Lentilactobacillus hilgardii]QIR10691.1 hypothetical protein G8J22_02702 [Lentilactobacillus hilgardii]
MTIKLGDILKQTRQAQHMTQKQLAEGICSQSMLSAIEKGQYTPNANLLIALCRRLKISLDDISLSSNFAIGRTRDFNQKLDRLCNQHQYQKLFDFLQKPSVLDAIETDGQTQAYYYYLGVSKWHLQQGLQDVAADFQLSLASAQPTHLSVLTRLGMMSLAMVRTQLGQLRSSEKLLAQAVSDIETAEYEENLNIVFYLAGLICFESEHYAKTANWVLRGIDFATGHDSHYMLANLYYLLARTAEVEAQLDIHDDAQERAKIFTELFHEKPYENF